MPKLLKNVIAMTDRSIKSLRPAEARVDYMFQSKVRGFGVTVYPSGIKTFFVRYTNSHRRTLRHVIGNYPPKTLQAARKAAENVVGRVADGEDPQAEKVENRRAETFGDFSTTYLADAQPRMKPRTYAEEKRVIRHDLLPAWRRTPIQNIRRRDIAAVLDGILARGSSVQANRTRSVCFRIFGLAVEREVVEHNPVVSLRKPTKERSRERVLSPAEIRTLWAVWKAEGSLVSLLYRMFLLTGQRRSLVASMQWAQIDGCWWVIPRKTTKNQKREHRVYLVPQAIEILAGLKRGGESPWVFPSKRKPGKPVGWVNKAKERYRSLKNKRELREALVTAGVALIDSENQLVITDEVGAAAVQKAFTTRQEEMAEASNWRPHDLRRTMATEMGDMGIPHDTIALVLGHVRGGVTAIYDRAARDYQVEAAMIAWGRRLEDILQGAERPRNVLSFPPGLAAGG
jgi:integrase